MALKSITLRLDEEEYEKLKQLLNEFGDPDINAAYVLRSYIRDLNRALPFMVKSGMDLKNYLGSLGSWMKKLGSMTDVDVLSKVMMNPWSLWTPGSPDESGPAGTADAPGKRSKGQGQRV